MKVGGVSEDVTNVILRAVLNTVDVLRPSVKVVVVRNEEIER